MEKNIIQIQEQINNLYLEKFQNYKENLGLSVPLIPKLSEKYFENRVIVLGQETNTWYRETNNDLYKVFLANKDNILSICLIKRYDNFIINHVLKYPGKFWEFNKMLYNKKIIKGEMIKNNNLSHCWLNLFLVEACKNKKSKEGCPTKDRKLANKIMEFQGNLLNQILEILKPNLIISLTGHTLDYYLKKHLIATTSKLSGIDENKVLTKEELGEFVVDNKDNFLANTKIIRCYHPTYFLGRINANKRIAKKLSMIHYKGTVSDYYKEQLFKKLEQYKTIE